MRGTVPDLIRFLDGPVKANAITWPSDVWPPPERMKVWYFGDASAIIGMFDADSDVPNVMESEEAIYVRGQFSVLPDDFDNPYVARGAEYTLEAA